MSEEKKQFVGPVPLAFLRVWLVRLGVVVFCAACLGVVWWSLMVRLQPVIRTHQKKALEMSRLADDVEQLRVKWAAESVQPTEARFNAARQQLFAGQEQILTWQDDTIRQASDLGLDIKIDLSPPQAYPGMEQKIAVVQADIDITAVAAGFTNPAYQRLLQFVEILAATDKRCDVTQLSAEGNFNSVRHARAVVRLLAEPKGTN
jgi:hypothetical protein